MTLKEQIASVFCVCIACGKDAEDGCEGGLFSTSRGGCLPNTPNNAVPPSLPHQFNQPAGVS